MVDREPLGPFCLGIEAMLVGPARRARRRTSRAAAGAPRPRPSLELSRAYSRIVSSIRKRSSPIGFRRLESTSAARRSRSALADLLRGLEREAPGEDREPLKELLGRSLEQVVAPLDRRAQRALALGSVTRAACQQRESRVEPLEQQSGARSFVRAAASSTASGSPSRRRQIASMVESGISSRPNARARSTKRAAASIDEAAQADTRVRPTRAAASGW